MMPLKKKRKIEQVEEVVFDTSAREEFLTGFHKRKQARIRHAQETAAKKERDEKIRGRQQLRQQRKKEVEDHVKAVNATLLRMQDGLPDAEDSDEDDRNDTAAKQHMANDQDDLSPYEEQYQDEDRHTTVTIETMDVNGNESHDSDESEGNAPSDEENNHQEAESISALGKAASKTPPKRRIWSKERLEAGKPKKKRKKFRYETKTERKLESVKQKRKSAEAARSRRENKSR